MNDQKESEIDDGEKKVRAKLVPLLREWRVSVKRKEGFVPNQLPTEKTGWLLGFVSLIALCSFLFKYAFFLFGRFLLVPEKKRY